MAKLTHKALEAIRSEQTGTVVREEGNLFGRVRTKGENNVVISFYYRFRLQNKLKDFSCGTWPTDSLSTIRSNRDVARAQVANGIDPGMEKKVARHARQEVIAEKIALIELQRTENLTLKNLFDSWLADGVRRKDGNAMIKRMFEADVLPAIGSIELKKLTEHHLRTVLRNMVDRGVNRSAVMMRNNLTQMFAWGRKRQPWRKLMVDGDPMELIEIEKIVAPDYNMDNARSRILTLEEIRELHRTLYRLQSEYEKAPNKRIVPQPLELTTQRAIWIMLSTMCRVGEMSKARWENIDFDAAIWLIPKKDVKDNVADLTVHMSDFTLRQFRQLHQVTGNTAFCFPSRNGDTHIDLRAISKQVGDRQSQFKKGRDGGPAKPLANRRTDNTLVLAGGANGAWTPHDLRRTGATMMQGLGIPLDIIDRCQNHVLEGSKVRRHYLHHDYAKEKHAAWAGLGDQLDATLGSTVSSAGEA
jgi:integrase